MFLKKIMSFFENTEEVAHKVEKPKKIESFLDDTNREIIASKIQNYLIISCKANDNDLHEIYNYIGDYNEEISYNVYADKIAKEYNDKFEDSNELKEYALKFLYGYRDMEKFENAYEDFCKNKILFYFVLKAIPKHENCKVYLFKQLS